MKKLFLKYGKSKTIVGGPLIILAGILIFVLVPPLAKALNKVAVFSTKINFLKNVGFKDCFKQTEHDQRNFNALPENKENSVFENKQPQEITTETSSDDEKQATIPEKTTSEPSETKDEPSDENSKDNAKASPRHGKFSQLKFGDNYDVSAE